MHLIGIWCANARTFRSISSAVWVEKLISPSSFPILQVLVTSLVGWGCLFDQKCSNWSITSAASCPPNCANLLSSSKYVVQDGCSISSRFCAKRLPASISLGCKSMIETPASRSPASNVNWIGAGPRHRGSNDGWMFTKGICEIILGGTNRAKELTMPTANAEKSKSNRDSVLGGQTVNEWPVAACSNGHSSSTRDKQTCAMWMWSFPLYRAD